MELEPINEKAEGDSGYVALYKGRQVALYAAGTYAAQQAAAAHFKARKAYEVNVILAENKDGEQVTHAPMF